MRDFLLALVLALSLYLSLLLVLNLFLDFFPLHIVIILLALVLFFST